MSIAVLLLFLSAAALAALAVALVRFNKQRLYVIHCADYAPEDALTRIYRAVESLVNEPLDGYVLARTNRAVSDDQLLIPLTGLRAPTFWIDRQVQITVEGEVAFSW